MSNVPGKVFIKVESNVEQQENMKNSRKTFKILQRDAIDKENLVGRPKSSKGGFKKSKSEFDIKIQNAELLKRKKIDTKTVETQTEANVLLAEKKLTITASDLTTAKPGEKYWEVLAEKRQFALEATLIENKNLHERIEGLESELNTSNKLLDEAKGLIELLSEMIEEKGSSEADTTTEDINFDDIDVNQGASTSGQASKYFDADSSESPNKIHVNNESDDDD